MKDVAIVEIVYFLVLQCCAVEIFNFSLRKEVGSLFIVPFLGELVLFNPILLSLVMHRYTKIIRNLCQEY